jgi:membrane fusion protein, multidrug efflux system
MGNVASYFSRHRRLARILVVAAGLLLIIGALAGVKAAQIGSLIGMGKKMEAMGPPPEAVGAAVAKAESWETSLSAVGTISGLRSVTLANEVPGTVTRIRFESGEIVREGQVLVELDAEVERAQRASAKARRDLAATHAERVRALVRGGAATRAQLDEAETQLATATTDFAALSAQLDRKVVQAPFKGRVGIRAVNVGQFLTPGTPLTTLDAIGAVFADFSLPQEELATIAVGMPVRVASEGARGEDAVQGNITAIEPTVDPVTRSVKVRALLPSRAQRPGMFVNVEVIKPKRASLVAVPATAVVHASFGDSVFIIEPKPPGSPGMAKTPDGKPVEKARQQFVRLGPTRGDFVAISKGVNAGQRVVTAGAFKLRNGSPVVVDNRVMPKPELDPKPENR